MKLAIGEIWKLLDLAVSIDGKNIQLNLQAGDFWLKNLSPTTLDVIRDQDDFHSDILEELFINREVLWQPNVYAKVEVCITNLSLFSVFCREEIERLTQEKNKALEFYSGLFTFLSDLSQEAIAAFSKILKESPQPNQSDEEGTKLHDPKNQIPVILGRFRKQCYPVIKVFMELLPPTNLVRRNARNRMDFAVEIIINQYNLKYSDIISPSWEVIPGGSETKAKSAPAATKAKTAPSETIPKIESPPVDPKS